MPEKNDVIRAALPIVIQNKTITIIPYCIKLTSWPKLCKLNPTRDLIVISQCAPTVYLETEEAPFKKRKLETEKVNSDDENRTFLSQDLMQS